MAPSIGCLLVVLTVSATLCAQTVPTVEQKPHRPSVGLVLEGGGALGLAHIGVLQWLEEHRIPVDYVAGTSMGGLVGGIYATGHSSDEVKAMVNTIEWDQVLQGNTPYRDLSFRRKQDAFEYPNKLEFGLKKGLQFPEGFNSGPGDITQVRIPPGLAVGGVAFHDVFAWCFLPGSLGGAHICRRRPYG